MELVISFLNTVLPVFYFIATYLYGMYFFREDTFAEKYMSPVLKTTVFIHFVEIVLRGWYYHHFPLASVAEAMSVLALAAVLIYLFLETRLNVKTTGYFILVFVFFLQLFSSAFISFTKNIPDILHSPLFSVHTSMAILSYSGFAISFLYSLMYLLLFHDIKSSRFGVIYSRLPSLEVLSGLNYSSAAVGFSFLTLAMFLGVIWSRNVFGSYFVDDPKIFLVYATWVIYGTELFGGKVLKWSNKKLAYLSLGGFIFIVLSVVAVNLFFTSFHEFR